MHAFVDMVATIVVAMAAAVLSLFGVRVQSQHAPPPPRPPVISRTAVAQPQAPAALITARPVIADCPLRKARPAATRV